MNIENSDLIKSNMAITGTALQLRSKIVFSGCLFSPLQKKIISPAVV